MSIRWIFYHWKRLASYINFSKTFCLNRLQIPCFPYVFNELLQWQTAWQGSPTFQLSKFQNEIKSHCCVSLLIPFQQMKFFLQFQKNQTNDYTRSHFSLVLLWLHTILLYASVLLVSYFFGVSAECRRVCSTWKLLRYTESHSSSNYAKSVSRRGYQLMDISAALPTIHMTSLLSIAAVSPGYCDYSILQSFTKYLRLTLVFMWNSALPEKFNLCF